MTNRMPLAHRLGNYLLYVGIIFFLLLLVVIPVQSQNPVATEPGPPEATQLLYQDAPTELLIFLVAQFVFLLIVVFSYRVSSARLLHARKVSVPHRWHGFLHLPH